MRGPLRVTSEMAQPVLWEITRTPRRMVMELTNFNKGPGLRSSRS